MKKLMRILFALCITVTAGAQTINDIPIDSIKGEYLEIVGTAKLLSLHKVTIQIDYGQERKFIDDIRLKDAEGKPIVLNGMIDALNFLAEYGWEYCDAYAVTISNSNVYHYVLKRKKSTE